jgi:uncharacterized membrane protein
MPEALLFLCVLGLGLWLFLLRGEVAFLRRRIEQLEDGQHSPQEPAAIVEQPKPPPEPVEPFKVAAKATTRRTASVVTSEILRPASPPVEPESLLEPQPEPSFKNPLAGASFEDLVGGKLPIWIGGIALVFAGFFLVRYTIEAGLLGPGARSVLATIFALMLIALSEFGGRLPKIGASFVDDPRVGQSLAGAGVATLYGTLYMASEIYGLVTMPLSFVLVVVVTAIAFVLSLRHGPPTALMGLAGGFAAPWVAGMGAANLPTLLLYLAVFIAALFGLAIWRRWLWLLVLASGGGAIWSVAMLVTASSGLPFLGLFILFVGVAAVFALDRFGESDSRWVDIARYAPMALALVQLAMLLPLMNFSVTAWTFYGALSALAIALAWREPKMALVMLGALVLAVSPLSLAWSEHSASATTLAATLGFILLFGLAGHVALRREGQPVLPWTLAALGAPILGWFAAATGNQDAFSDTVWGVAALIVALPSAHLAWEQHRKDRPGVIQRLATVATTLMAMVACIILIDDDWVASYCAAMALGIAAWARITDDAFIRRLAVLPLAAAMLATLVGSYRYIEAFGASISGQQTLFQYLPDFTEAIRQTLIPSLLILGLLWQRWFASGSKTRIAAWAVGGAGISAIVWQIAKQPASIETSADFIRLGFAERAIFTHALFAGGWLALAQGSKRPDWKALPIIGWVLVAVALFRLVWFDLLLLNPVFVAQAVGPVPIANLATAHMALVAIWLWLLARFAPDETAWKGGKASLHILSLGAMIIATLATVRQAIQGSILSGGFIDTGENYLYSAALLALAIAWLARGMMAGSRLLRLGGLALLTLVTLKVFLIDAASLTGVLRILSFLGLGIALIGIGWAYGRLMGTAKARTDA